MAKSVLQSNRECFVCGRVDNLHRHHVFYGTSNRTQSEKHGMWVWLCMDHHTGDHGVHFYKPYDLELKQMAQRKFEETRTRDEFRAIFGKSYLM